MDLTPTTFLPAEPPAEGAPDWAALVASASARAMASPTALAHARLVARGARSGGSFAPFVAIRLTEWQR